MSIRYRLVPIVLVWLTAADFVQCVAANKPPPPPTLITPANGANDVDSKNATLLWKLNPDPDGDKIVSYLLIREHGQPWKLDAPGDLGSAMSHKPTTLRNGVRYDWAVAAVDWGYNSEAWFRWSPVRSFTTKELPPVITTHPKGQSVPVGSSVTFTVVAESALPLSYQWKRDGKDITGATGATLNLRTVSITDAGTYTVVVSNTGGSVTSENAVLTVLDLPMIMGQPQSLTVIAGSTVSFSVLAQGGAPLSYQWQKDGVNIAGANAATLDIKTVSLGDAGTYTLVVHNSVGRVTSSPAMLRVLAPSTGAKQPNLAVTTPIISGMLAAAPNRFYAGETTLRVTIINQGAAIPQTFGNTLQYRNVATNGVWTDWMKFDVTGLNSGAWAKFENKWDSGAGEWEFRLVADRTNSVIESNEGDNVSEATRVSFVAREGTPTSGNPTTGGTPKLKLDTPTIMGMQEGPGRFRADSLTIKAEATNIGDGYAPRFVLQLQYSRDNREWTNWVEVEAPTLAPGATRSISYGWGGGSGVWYFRACENVGNTCSSSVEVEVVSSSVVLRLTREGDSEILFQDDSGALAVWAMKGVNRVSDGLLSASGASNPGRAVGTGDFNKDGNADVLFQKTDGSLLVWFVDGKLTRISDGSLTPNKPTDASYRAVGTADMDRDGQTDIVLQNDQGGILVWLMNGTTRRSESPLSTDANWRVAAIGDLDGDGKADFVFQHKNGDLAMWKMDGVKLVKASLLIPSKAGSGWRVAGASDRNGDGKADILFQHDNLDLAVWFMDAEKSTSTQTLKPTNPGGTWQVPNSRQQEKEFVVYVGISGGGVSRSWDGGYGIRGYANSRIKDYLAQLGIRNPDSRTIEGLRRIAIDNEAGGLAALALYVFDTVNSESSINTAGNTADIRANIEKWYNSHKNAKIIIAGHSLGGGDTQNLLHSLNTLGIPVQLSGHIDSVGIGDASIPKNTRRAMGFYQNESIFSNPLTWGEGGLYAVDPMVTLVTNKKISPPIGPADPTKDFNAYHRNMDNDEAVWGDLLFYMQRALLIAK